MTFRPMSRDELAAALRSANERRSPIGTPNLRGFNRILEHTPEDMTVTVEAGVTLAALQTALAQRGQWLPVDPPRAGHLTIAGLLSMNVSGPRRYGFGTIRDHLIGLHVALADGRLVRSGGKVVKNVAGFDLLKLFVGARDTIGLIVEATFKLLPLPETERFVGATCPTLEVCGQAVDAVLESGLNPTVLDCHNLGLGEADAVVVLGFSGTREDVEWQASQAAALGFREPATLEYEREFWDQSSPVVQRWSVLPSRLVEALRELRGVKFVARAGNGVIYHRGDPRASSSLPTTLLRRVKEIFDPNHILPGLPV
jgi:glycolate oxidase FAD binding subunit